MPLVKVSPHVIRCVTSYNNIDLICLVIVIFRSNAMGKKEENMQRQQQQQLRKHNKLEQCR